MRELMKKSRKRKKRTGRRIAVFIVILLALILIDSNVRIDTEEYEIACQNLPQEFDGYRIAVVSDLHQNDRWQENGKLTEKIAETEPDIIAVTGDLVDEPGHEEYVRDLMTELTAIAPVYYVTGNHEWASVEVDELFELLDDAGVKALRNEYVELTRGGETLVLAGIDDPNGPYDMKTPQELMNEIRAAKGSDEFTVLLAHRNDKMDVYKEIEVPLVICGHGHGGIVRLPFTDGLISTSREWFPSYTSGLYTEEGTTMLVSRGLGSITGIPRILNNPHIPVAVLKCEA